MRIAFFGGSFDPPHRGHLAIARAAVQRLALDVVWMAPAGVQPLKMQGASTSYEDRLAMVRLAVAGDFHVVASDIDAPRIDGLPNYTIEVITSIRDNLQSGDALFFLLGADAFLTLKQWHRADELLFLSDFIVAARPGVPMEELEAALPEGVSAIQLLRESESSDIAAWALRNPTGNHSTLYAIPDLHEDISATEIRAALSGEHSAAGVLAPAVLRYIEERGLYR